jgi:hypothetical protein
MPDVTVGIPILSRFTAMQFAFLAVTIVAAFVSRAYALRSCNNTLLIDDYKYYLRYENMTMAGDIRCQYAEIDLVSFLSQS